ncbi:MAG: hypothetical protein HC810_07540 [Acaryochloridaceae cyanobacterium RL_2_7]|nr:hypothetical protein [Acaryochloridaceae cyanobacterium RL_2_7]
MTSEQALQSLSQQATQLNPLQRPILWNCPFDEILARIQREEHGLQFDRIIGRNLLSNPQDLSASIETVTALIQKRLAVKGEVILAEISPKHSQRIYDLVNLDGMKSKLTRDWKTLEDSFYSSGGDPRLNWDARDIEQALLTIGLQVDIESMEAPMQWFVSPSVLQRWFGQAKGRSYGDRLRNVLSRSPSRSDSANPNRTTFEPNHPLEKSADLYQSLTNILKQKVLAVQFSPKTGSSSLPLSKS